MNRFFEVLIQSAEKVYLARTQPQEKGAKVHYRSILDEKLF
jgi:hypothetical protein